MLLSTSQDRFAFQRSLGLAAQVQGGAALDRGAMGDHKISARRVSLPRALRL